MRRDTQTRNFRSTVSRWPQPKRRKRSRRLSENDTKLIKETKFEEPPWAGQVQDKGDLFYIEPFRESSSPPSNDLEHLQINGEIPSKDKNNAVFKKLTSVKRILPSLRKDKNDDKKTDQRNNLKNSLTADGLDMSKGKEKTRSNCIKKDVHVIVTPPKLGSGRNQSLETLLGIIPGRDKTGRLSQNDSYSGSRIYIKGFVPDGPSLKCGELRIGDVILALNKLDLNSSNVHTILAAITGPMEIILTIQRFNQPPTPVISSNTPTKDDSHLIQLISGQPSVQPRLDLRGLPHLVMYLSITSSEDDEPNKDILYQYPMTEEAASLLAVRGVFLTLSDLLISVTGGHAQSSTLMLKKKLVNIGYYKSGKHVLIICLPSEKVSLLQLKKLMTDISRVLHVIFGSIDRAFCDGGNKGRLDHFFALLFESTLGARTKENTSVHLCDSLPGVRWLNLPTTTMVNINCCLSELEAADYGELVDELFQIRRLYTILGSCIFYKGMLLANHLVSEDFQDILLYCKYYCLLNVGQEQRIGQLVVWKEIFLSRRRHRDNRTEYREPSGRHFLLIVGRKHMLLCVLLEAGGMARKAEGHPGPDSYYVEQLKNTLMQIETLDVASVCESSIHSTRSPPISSADVLLSSPSLTSNLERNSLGITIPGSPPQWRRHGSLDSLKLPGDELDSSDSGSLPSGIKRRGSDSSGSVNSLTAKGKMRSFRSLSSLLSVGSLRKSFTESPFEISHSHNSRLTSGKENTLLNYVTFDSFNGVLVCPISNDPTFRCGTVHTEVLKTFHNTCLTIRRLFLPYYKQRLKTSSSKNKDRSFFTSSGPEGVIEHGVQFHRVPDSNTEQKKSSAILKYWVIGRLFGGEHPKEFYVCYHSSVPQNTVEMAFKLGFGVTL
ncbi:protein inturned-like isoform X2 [Actinia tenebrosa]|uniref:Protein inturned n=1 Tax=Actinia tenebrosa TaxID=6105 RepID=A0A6P8HMK8_ACTTE|nr:protein inturned-like isoform X2 [Actinia tenebrosa]XP_031556948.1 protein inturned-like isoform X2 [Actinia tenebrosa]